MDQPICIQQFVTPGERALHDLLVTLLDASGIDHDHQPDDYACDFFGRFDP